MTAPASATSTALPRLPDPRTAVVTGAGGPAGIGRATARALAESGWHVALVDINAEGLAGVEQELRKAGHALRYVTNNSTRPRSRLAEELREMGFTLEDDEL